MTFFKMFIQWKQCMCNFIKCFVPLKNNLGHLNRMFTHFKSMFVTLKNIKQCKRILNM